MYGGGWLYAMEENRISLGLMVGLHYADTWFEPHTALQQLKQHPHIRRVLEGGRILRYGAKSISAGGYWALPQTQAPGALLVGDAAGYVNTRRMKGIHLAMKTGMLAAETSFAVLTAGKEPAPDLTDFNNRVRASWVEDEMWMSRNFHQGFENGMMQGMAQGLLQLATGGRGLWRRARNRAGHEYLKKKHRDSVTAPSGHDEHLSFDRQTSVYYSATRHEEQQPAHLLVHNLDVCATRCHTEFGNPCTRFCPAGVYEWVESGGTAALKLNPANCLHCKACDIMDPYRNITWVPPEGGGGPRYDVM
jgi:electron-transferring-flavoprotein dehydrogenase